MAFVSSGLQKILDTGIANGAGMYAYTSSDPHGTVEGADYFEGAGFGSHSTAAAGMKVGDLVAVLNVSTAGSSAFTWHRVDSLSTSTGWHSSIHATISAAAT